MQLKWDPPFFFVRKFLKLFLNLHVFLKNSFLILIFLALKYLKIVSFKNVKSFQEVEVYFTFLITLSEKKELSSQCYLRRI